MKYKISFGTTFKRDFKIIKKRGYPIEQMNLVFDMLENTGKLSGKYQPHKLSGNYADCWE